MYHNLLKISDFFEVSELIYLSKISRKVQAINIFSDKNRVEK